MNNLDKGFYIKKLYGFITPIQKGGGSAIGRNSANPDAEWTPKSEDAKRFLGKPGEIKETYDKNGERRLTKIGEDGKANKERQFSDHKKPHKHTNPHDHTIEWINGKPRLGQPINYPKGEISEFKSKEINILYTKNEHILIYPKYESIKEFTESLIDGREIEIEWNGIHYTIEYEGESQNNFSICEAYKPETETHFNSVEKLLNSKIKSGECLKDIILKAEIKWRNL